MHAWNSNYDINKTINNEKKKINKNTERYKKPFNVYKIKFFFLLELGRTL